MDSLLGSPWHIVVGFLGLGFGLDKPHCYQNPRPILRIPESPEDLLVSLQSLVAVSLVTTGCRLLQKYTPGIGSKLSAVCTCLVFPHAVLLLCV